MTIDMSQFHEILFEECHECLGSMESELLALDVANIDSETINTIFRGAHTIKGGCLTFGFTVVADYAHTMEVLLNEMRDGRRKVTRPIVDALLASVGCLKEMVTAMQSKQDIDEASAAKHKAILEAELNGGVKI